MLKSRKQSTVLSQKIRKGDLSKNFSDSDWFKSHCLFFTINQLALTKFGRGKKKGQRSRSPGDKDEMFWQFRRAKQNGGALHTVWRRGSSRITALKNGKNSKLLRHLLKAMILRMPFTLLLFRLVLPILWKRLGSIKAQYRASFFLSGHTFSSTDYFTAQIKRTSWEKVEIKIIKVEFYVIFN